MKNKIIKVLFIVFAIILTIPSIIYILQNKTVMGFNTYFNFFINKETDKILSTVIYLAVFISLMIMYLITLKQKKLFKNIRQILKYVGIVSIIFAIMLPWTTSDIYYYMGVGELDSQYNQNPYYVTMKQYYEDNKENINDTILEHGVDGVWANTTVVYGPIAQLIFKMCTAISLKNIDLCLLIFKILNLVIHLANCYLIYKLSNKKFAVIYGLNPFVLIEFIGNVHNDIIVVFFILLSLYFLIKKGNLILSIIFLALATGIKYFTIILLPIVILYHFRKVKSLGKRFFSCIIYGLLFLIILFIEYTLYFEDFQVLTAMFAQTAKYSRSIHSVILQKNVYLMEIIKMSIEIIFFMYYAKLCIDLLIQKDIKFYKIIKKYNIALILFFLILTTFQPWYLIWLFATIMWQKPKMITDIVVVTAATEIANSIYMFKSEWYIYDIYFVGIIIFLFVIWQVISRRKRWIN